MTHPRIVLPDAARDLVVIASVSGGKDSTALICALREAEIPARYVFADTGWEAAETYEYLDTLRRTLGITIDVVRSERGTFLEIATQKAGFPWRAGRWCTDELKRKPLRAYHTRVSEECDTETVSAVGIRAEESAARAAMAEWEFDPRWDGYVWRPLLRWTEREVYEIHHRHGVPINPLYKRGHNRVGCYPCVLADKQEVALVAKNSPDRINLIEMKEQEFTLERHRRNQNGEGDFKHTEATFFQAKRPGQILTIRDAVAWARTDRGGRQLPLWENEPSGGCMRLGLSEHPSRNDDHDPYAETLRQLKGEE